MVNIKLKEFVPPILNRVMKFLIRRIKHPALFRPFAGIVLPPFDAVPKGLSVKWLLDVGANHGDVAEAALITYPDCNVLCFEPVKETFELLKKRQNRISSMKGG